MNYKEIVVKAIHNLCEDCILKHDCQEICNEINLVKKVAFDVRNNERELCINTIREQMSKLLYPIEDIDLICDHTRKAMEGGSHES